MFVHYPELWGLATAPLDNGIMTKLLVPVKYLITGVVKAMEIDLTLKKNAGTDVLRKQLLSQSLNILMKIYAIFLLIQANASNR